MKRIYFNNKKKVIIISICFLLFILIGVSYAFFSYLYVGNGVNIVQTGEITFLASDKTIELTNVFPTTYKNATEAATVSIYGYTTYENGIDFQIKAFDVSTKNENIIPTIIVERETIDGVTYTDEKEMITTYGKDNRITSDTILCEGNIAVDTIVGSTDEHIKLLSIKIYYDKADYHISDNTREILIEEGMLSSDYEGEIIDTTTWNELNDDESVAAYSFKIQVIATEGEAPKYLKNKVLETLPLTEADADGTKFVYGSEVSNNYVWYSGKMWRITSINDDGNIKLVTNNEATVLSWDTTCSSNDYSNSLVRNWLNTYFIETLSNEDLIVDSEWDYTPSSDTDIVKPNKSNVVTDKVGLLNLYEYSMAGSNNFLRNKYIWWTLTPSIENTNSIWLVAATGSLYAYVACEARGVRPSIVFVDNIKYTSGDGTVSNPYKIKNDISVAEENDSLNTRISGEYVRFDDTLYRIVDKETVNDSLLTKVTMSDYSVNRNTIAQNQLYAGETDDNVFNTTNGIGKVLNDWYLNNVSQTYRDMIATPSDGVIWYSGPLEGANRDYKLSKSGDSINATVGLPYYGEIFASQTGAGYNESYNFWTMTRYSDSIIWIISDYNTGSGFELSKEAAVRPSFYLKSNVLIGDADGDGNFGNGTKEYPYELIVK